MTILFCIPPAGGLAASFNEFSRVIGTRTQVVPLERAGRGARAGERGPASIEDAACDVARVVAADAGGAGWALYGHSMGGLIAFEAARVLQSLGIPGGQHLFVSGCPAPQRRFGLSWNERTPDAEVHRFLREVAGFPAEIAQDSDALSYYSALARSDEGLLAKYAFRQSESLNLPTTVIVNAADPVTRGQDPREWEKATGSPQAAGIPTVICGPGSISQAHQPDEGIAVGQLQPGYRFLAEVARWAQGGQPRAMSS
jgi:surfactin synthase thioesterase subunit